MLFWQDVEQLNTSGEVNNSLSYVPSSSFFGSTMNTVD